MPLSLFLKEKLTLYVIELKKENERQNKEIAVLNEYLQKTEPAKLRKSGPGMKAKTMKYKTRYPMILYFIFICLIIQAVMIFDFPALKIAFYLFLTFFFLYMLLARYACRVKVYDHEIIAEYFFFWEKDLVIPLSDISGVDFNKGFYDLFSDKTTGGVHVFPKYCYDTLLLKNQSGAIISVEMNTRIWTFNKVVSTVRDILDKKNR